MLGTFRYINYHNVHYYTQVAYENVHFKPHYQMNKWDGIEDPEEMKEEA